MHILFRENSTTTAAAAIIIYNEQHQHQFTRHMMTRSKYMIYLQFSAFVARGIIRDMEGWYLGQSKKFSAIVALGRDVAGFPRVVHGGLTAAIFDEAFGGLLFSLKKAGGVTFFGPAYTVQLEVSYKAKIPAGQIILCTAEVESMAGRKLWMKAVMMDGPDGKVYATARALFVAPKFTRLVTDVAKYIGQRMGEIVTGSGGGSGTS